ncbi:hypothetical protein [Roseiflexus sp.]|uniref:hypothetical protein n=1 Tax=Roseiflexus sp. TaxID=2562120 RepID=UPI0021DBB1F4|nr:hypothetical protein [Roseiflexus sp.]GIV99161.1 MAG: hypothetical protein KatS3mg058_0565 [Roseiflexus sp.]
MAQTNGSTHLVEEQRLDMRQGLRLRDELTDMLNTTVRRRMGCGKCATGANRRSRAA